MAAAQFIPGPVDDIALATKFLRGAGKATIAGLGGTAGKAIQSFTDPDVDFNFRELAKTFGEETAYEAVALGLAPIGRKLLKPVKRSDVAGIQKLERKLIERGKKLGIETPTTFLPAEFSDIQLIDTIQGIGEGSLIGSDILFRYKKGQLKAAASLVKEVPELISKGALTRSSDDVAALLIDAVENNNRLHKTLANRFYTEVANEMASEPVDITKLHATATKMLDRFKKAKNIGVSPASRKLVRQIASFKPDEATGLVLSEYGAAQDMISGMKDIIRQGSSKLTPDPKAVGTAKHLVGIADDAMNEATKRVSPRVHKMKRQADTFFRWGKETLNNKTLRSLTNQLSDPSLSKPDVANVIFKSRNNIMRVKNAVGKKAFQKAKGSWLRNIVQDSMVPDPKDIKGIGEPVGMKVLKKFNGVGQDTLDAAFTKAEQEVIRENARIMALMQAKTGGHAGALRFVQGAALAGVATGPLLGEQVGKKTTRASSAILVGPAVLGRLMATPGFGKWLKEGFEAPKGSQQSIALTARLIRNIFQARKEINEEREELRRQKRTQELTEKVRQPIPRELRGFGGRGF
jgi:hypothetical protein